MSTQTITHFDGKKYEVSPEDTLVKRNVIGSIGESVGRVYGLSIRMLKPQKIHTFSEYNKIEDRSAYLNTNVFRQNDGSYIVSNLPYLEPIEGEIPNNHSNGALLRYDIYANKDKLLYARNVKFKRNTFMGRFESNHNMNGIVLSAAKSNLRDFEDQVNKDLMKRIAVRMERKKTQVARSLFREDTGSEVGQPNNPSEQIKGLDYKLYTVSSSDKVVAKDVNGELTNSNVYLNIIVDIPKKERFTKFSEYNKNENGTAKINRDFFRDSYDIHTEDYQYPHLTFVGYVDWTPNDVWPGDKVVFDICANEKGFLYARNVKKVPKKSIGNRIKDMWR